MPRRDRAASLIADYEQPPHIGIRGLGERASATFKGVLAAAGIIALILGIAAGMLSWLAGTHPAGAILRGGATSVGVLVMEVAVLTFIWTAASGAA